MNADADDIHIFDRMAVRRHRDRAAAAPDGHDFLLVEIADRLADRLADTSRKFPLALDLGCHRGEIGRTLGGRGGIETLIQADGSAVMAKAAGGLALVADEEALPFAEGSFDLILSSLTLHWVNDLPGTLIQARRVLRPDGLFLAAMLGGETLAELREAIIEAEIAEEGGARPRISPFAEVRDAGSLLQRAGFALPVVDLDTITVSYSNALALMRDLRWMGEANAIAARPRTFTRRATLLRAAAIYADRFGDSDGRIPARFQILFLTGWAPHESQPKPARRGSGTIDLGQALKRK
ncbi:MAG: SAM-dependent methyltransferase [Rhodospirillaceae bacterium]|nr:SAM-dependent methyltransferase [Rhodospirillaceae bacterium]